MSRSVPHSRWRRCVPALVALACLVGPAATASAQQPDPAPLWKAFPLSPKRPAGSMAREHPTGAPLRVPAPARSRPARASGAGSASDGRSASQDTPRPVAIAFYGALAGLCAIAAGALTMRVMRRRSQPVTCEITWSPGANGDAFRATARLDGEEPWIVAQSRRFERDSPDPPAYDAASHQAYDELLRDLYADGWLPYERGREWWAMRLRRTAGPELTSSRDG
jgi:hypothetical protein